MRAVVQRVSSCTVLVDGKPTGSIGRGLLVYLGISIEDGDSDISYIAEKALNLRVFEDDEGHMNRSVCETGGEVFVVSQFTLYGDARKGRRPSWSKAAPHAHAEPLYERFLAALDERGIHPQCGTFGAAMSVECVVDGPVTILLDSSRQF